MQINNHQTIDFHEKFTMQFTAVQVCLETGVHKRFQHKNRQDNPRFSRTAPQSWKIQKKLSLGQGSFLQVFFSQEPALQCNKKNSKCILLYKKMS